MARFLFILFFLPLCAFTQERMVKNKDVELWTETFGASKNPTMLLIMGAGGPGIFWPDQFCEKLSKGGYFVIRYDHRDVGKSSLIDYEKFPYTLGDLAQDALVILDSYKVKKAHVVGASMGGFIGQILAINSPERLLSLVSMMSSPDESVLFAAIAGEDTSTYALPPPPPEAINIWNEMTLTPPKTDEERIALNLRNWKLCGGAAAYNEQECITLEKKNIKRTKSFEAAFNHWPAMTSYPSRLNDLKTIKTPTLVIHGDCDVVLPVEHGIATAKEIPGSKLVIVPEMGHSIGNYFSDRVAELILSHVRERI